MDQKIVLQKTEKGIEELETRKHRLSPALRMVLILVDGQSDVAGLRKKASGFEDLGRYLEELVRGSYIRNRSDLAAGSPAPETAGELGAESSATLAKWQIVDMVRDVVGGEYGDRATNRFTNIDDTPNAIRGALDECYQFILLTIDDKKAEVVKQKGKDILAKL